MAEQDPQKHSENPPAVTVEWPEGAETYIAATPIIDVAQGLLTACRAMVAALARHAGDASFGAEDARALEAGRAAIATAEGRGPEPGAG